MTILGLLALGSVGVWLLALTVLLVLTVRQFALLTVRLDTLGQHATDPPQGEDYDVLNDGLPVGARVPAEVLEAIPDAMDGTVYVLLISALCRSCRLLAADIEDRRQSFTAPFVALVPGPAAVAREIVAMLPPGTRAIHDPVAGTLAQTHLAVRSTPFLLRVERGTLTAKSFVGSVADLAGFMTQYPPVTTPSSAQRLPAA